MQVIFTQKEIDDAFTARKKCRIVWGVAFAVVIATVISMFAVFAWEVGMYHDRSHQTVFMVISMALSILFFGATVLLYDLKYRVIRAYCRMFTDIRRGVKEKNVGTVIELDRRVSQKDDVWFYSLVVECAPVRREQRNIRRLLIERNRPAPDLRAGDKIEFVAFGGMLIAYENVTPKEDEK